MAPEGPIRVSFVMTTRNRAAFLERALVNAREYVQPGDEFLLMDGGSTDGTPAVVDRFRDVITEFCSEPDFGEAHALNKGILRARGEVVKILTDDDYMYPDVMRDAIETLLRSGHLDALVCGGVAAFRDDSGEEWVEGYQALGPGEVVGRETIWAVGCGLGLLFRRSLVARVGLFDTSFKCTDTDFAWRLVELGCNVKYLHSRLFRHVDHAESIIRQVAVVRHDGARVRSRAGSWEVMMNMAPTVVAGVLGLRGLRYGESLVKLIWLAERVRRGPLGWLLPMVAVPGEAVLRAWRALRQSTRQAYQHQPPGPDREPPEPAWDGSIS